MKKTLDFNKLARALKAKKAWEQLQKEKRQNESESQSNRDSSNDATKSRSEIRISS